MPGKKYNIGYRHRRNYICIVLCFMYSRIFIYTPNVFSLEFYLTLI